MIQMPSPGVCSWFMSPNVNTICFAAALLSCLFRVTLSERNRACRQRTIEHHCCLFPFYYKQSKYKRCTSHGDVDNRFWCATDAKYSKNDTGWGYCKLKGSECFVKTTDETCCILPFQYRGTEYDNCVVGKFPSLHWCATRPSFNRSKIGSGWGYCAGTTCYSCRSNESWEHCHNNMAKKTCPYGIQHCITSTREVSHSSNNITKLFLKDCASQSVCPPKSLHCDQQTSGVAKCTLECCHGELCNLGKGSSPDGYETPAVMVTLILAFKSVS